MSGLSHGVIRVNTEDKNSALTVQDVGHVMPGGEHRKKHTQTLRFQNQVPHKETLQYYSSYMANCVKYRNFCIIIIENTGGCAAEVNLIMLIEKIQMS